MELHAAEAGSGRPLVVLHGLLGSSRNWGGIMRVLADGRRVIALDLPNHGASPWTASISYTGMAAEIGAAIEKIGAPAAVLGHSMGGKVAMVLALTRPDLVERVVVVDIAPVSYTHGFASYIRAMRAVPMDLPKRADVDAFLARSIPDARVRGFLLQNLDGTPGGWRWKPNLAVLEEAMGDILGFPAFPPGTHYQGPSLFVAGGESDYVGADGEAAIHRLFPTARVARVEGAGHWVHADQPEAFTAKIRDFLSV